MQTKQIATNGTYTVERQARYASCVNQQVEWIVRLVSTGMIEAEYKTKRDAMQWLKIK